MRWSVCSGVLSLPHRSRTLSSAVATDIGGCSSALGAGAIALERRKSPPRGAASHRGRYPRRRLSKVRDEKSSGAASGDSTSVRTFLIADLRGYTRYSDENGDEAASALARRFAAIAGDAVTAQSGEMLELRGDEALCVFESARSAVRAPAL